MKPNLDDRPFIVIWETTQACEMACVHCRASARPLRDPRELTTEEAKRLIDEIAVIAPPVFVITGGDPLQRPDLFQLIEYAVTAGLHVAVTPSVTSLLTHDTMKRFKDAGVSRIALSLDGSNPSTHDTFRGIRGSFDATLQAIHCARATDLPLQINTTYTQRNYRDLDAMINLVQLLDIVLWSVFFLVPTGRGEQEQMLSPIQCERIFGKLYELSRHVNFGIKTTEAMHYRRYVLQQDGLGFPASAADLVRNGSRAPRGINDAKGFVFVSHIGEVYPSGFLPTPAGNIRQQSLLDIYRDSEVFRMLRDSNLLKGKCGACEYKNICGGSRARAFALYGDALAEDPSCIYVPKKVQEARRAAMV